MSKFAVEVTPRPPHRMEYDAEFKVAITHNGYQWQAIGLSGDEMRKVIDAMQTALGGSMKRDPLAIEMESLRDLLTIVRDDLLATIERLNAEKRELAEALKLYANIAGTRGGIARDALSKARA